MWRIVLIFSLISILIVRYLIFWRPPKFPPGPRGLPIVGNIIDIKKLIKKTKSFASALTELSEIYGNVLGLKLGLTEPLIVVTGKDTVFEMLSRHEFDGRPNEFLYRLRTGGTRRGIIFTDREVWNYHRRFAMKTLKDFGFGKVTMEQLILEDVISYVNIVEKLSNDGPIENLRTITGVAVINSLWRLISSHRHKPNEVDPKLEKIINVILYNSKHINVSGGILNHLPFLRYFFPKATGMKTLNDRITIIREFFSGEVAEHKKDKIPGESKDLIDAYLEEMQTQNSTSTYYNEEELVALIQDLFVAGIETTTSSICFVLTYLSVYSNVQKKIHQEIDAVINKDVIPTMAHKTKLPYLCATLAEVSRISTIGPTTIFHRATKDTTLFGYEIKKNYNVVGNLTSIHMDENHWGDPQVFRPERFIDEEGQFITDPWLIPFGLGRRKCPGEILAKQSQFLFVCCLMHKFNFMLPSNQTEFSLFAEDSFINAPPNINFLVTKR